MSISEQHIKRFFNSFSSVRLALPQSAGNLFECFVFLVFCKAASTAGFQVTLCSPNTNKAIFRFRASPGPLNPQFGYAKLQRPNGTIYELHNDLEVLGLSGMEHEADILLLDLDSQPKPTSATNAHLRLTIECKLYSNANRLKGEVRKFVGAALDWSRGSHASHLRNTQQGCLYCGTGFVPLFVTNIANGVRQDIEGYIETHDMIPVFSVDATPGSIRNLVTVIQNELAKLP